MKLQLTFLQDHRSIGKFKMFFFSFVFEIMNQLILPQLEIKKHYEKRERDRGNKSKRKEI